MSLWHFLAYKSSENIENLLKILADSGPHVLWLFADPADPGIYYFDRLSDTILSPHGVAGLVT